MKPWIDKTIHKALNSRTAAYNVGIINRNMNEYKPAAYGVRRMATSSSANANSASTNNVNGAIGAANGACVEPTIEQRPLIITESDVRRVFKRVNNRKAVGPDGICGTVLKACADQLAPVFTNIFNLSLMLGIVLSSFKQSTIVPVPKKPLPSGLNDYRPVALTSVVMKCFEKLVRDFITSSLPASMDPLQFAYHHNWSTDDTIAHLLHTTLPPLDNGRGNYVKMLFVNYSSAFNTIIPSLLTTKLEDLGLHTSLCDWISNLLTDRPQSLRVGNCVSSTLTLSTGAPQGCVLSPLLYLLYTYDCSATSSSTIIVKFTDDTVIMGLISDNDERAYLEEIKHLENWSQGNNLLLNVSKTKELIVDCSKKQERHYQPVRINRIKVERVDNFRYLGVHISQDLSWSHHTNSLAKKACQHLYHLRHLRDFRLPSESILTGDITVWFGNSTKQDRQALQASTPEGGALPGSGGGILQAPVSDIADSGQRCTLSVKEAACKSSTLNVKMAHTPRAPVISAQAGPQCGPKPEVPHPRCDITIGGEPLLIRRAALHKTENRAVCLAPPRLAWLPQISQDCMLLVCQAEGQPRKQDNSQAGNAASKHPGARRAYGMKVITLELPFQALLHFAFKGNGRSPRLMTQMGIEVPREPAGGSTTNNALSKLASMEKRITKPLRTQRVHTSLVHGSRCCDDEFSRQDHPGQNNNPGTMGTRSFQHKSKKSAKGKKTSDAKAVKTPGPRCSATDRHSHASRLVPGPSAGHCRPASDCYDSRPTAAERHSHASGHTPDHRSHTLGPAGDCCAPGPIAAHCSRTHTAAAPMDPPVTAALPGPSPLTVAAPTYPPVTAALPGLSPVTAAAPTDPPVTAALPAASPGAAVPPKDPSLAATLPDLSLVTVDAPTDPLVTAAPPDPPPPLLAAAVPSGPTSTADGRCHASGPTATKCHSHAPGFPTAERCSCASGPAYSWSKRSHSTTPHGSCQTYPWGFHY
ncbi:hypothetical protein P4O66_001822 [Electrophorus voltai]|uniref:Reverse transcriptase domain-containing protein n=1 Tax=Electrophorus voltai TaxID=2609070 RepID=A0AAD8Z2V2_9TELE|nr:hypothetical protein P4O66_001822 [Electrophorus voltai]